MRKEIIIIGLVILIALLLFFFPKPGTYDLSDAKGFVIEDLRSKYYDQDPDADIEILTSSETPENYLLRAKVTLWPNSPCPERIHETYDLSADNINNFVTKPEEYITTGCRVCVNEPRCILAFKEEAIIASHTIDGTGDIRNFLTRYSDATPTAQLLEFESVPEAWVVEWFSEEAGKSYFIALSKNESKILEKWTEDADTQ